MLLWGGRMQIDAEVTIEDIIAKIKTYQPDAPIDLVRQAFSYAREAHTGQIRASGEEYIFHPLGVAKILASA